MHDGNGRNNLDDADKIFHRQPPWISRRYECLGGLQIHDGNVRNDVGNTNKKIHCQPGEDNSDQIVSFRENPTITEHDTLL